MKKRILSLLLVFISFPAFSSHIVGGEIELLHISGFSYRVNLIYYFDVARNPTRKPQTEEPNVDLYIYRKSDDKLMRSVKLPFLVKTRVPYTQPSCSSGEIISDKLIYSSTVTLNAADYSDPSGYYIVWARCCRNYSILNIFSQDPTHGGIAAGQTFYLEFPPVTKDGKPFVNSSPKDFPALNDYACPTKPYYVDFAGVDVDGDSLAYSLITPLSTVSINALPPPTPQPYPNITWLPGFGLDKIVNGSPKELEYPDLRINSVGFLRVTPRSQGLFVFAVKVEEFRNKVKIGEVRRDFQMLVTDCKLSTAPEISGKTLSATTFTSGNLQVNYSNLVADADRCIEVKITDEDATRAQDNFREYIKLKVVPLNFKGPDVSSLLPAVTDGFIEGNGDIQFRICFPACPFISGGAYQVGVIAFDDACALPLSDTLKVEVNIEPPANERVKFLPPDEVTATLNEGDQMTWSFTATDADKDQLVFLALTEGFSLAQSGMTTDITSNGNGTLQGFLKWDAFCDIYDFTKRTSFNLKLLVDDMDKCDLNDPDTLTYHLNVTLPGDAVPIIDTDLTPNPAEIVVDLGEKRIFEKIQFKVTGQDLIDNDLVTVQIKGDGYKPEALGMVFPKKSAKGTVSSDFNWTLDCGKFNLDNRDEFNISFLAIDSTGRCRVRNVDSLVVKVKVLKPINNPPSLQLISLNPDIKISNYDVEMAPGQPLTLNVQATDVDTSPADKLNIDLIDAGGDFEPLGFTFTPAVGVSVLQAPFFWQPTCDIFKGGDYQNEYYFDFRYSDDRCLTAFADTVRVKVIVKDLDSDGFEMDPANVFTPNGDGINDYYAMERRDENGDLINILPPDNCRGVFERIRIYNRWGELVFTSNDRNFRWLGLTEAAGVYFYHITFTNREFKGTVSLRD